MGINLEKNTSINLTKAEPGLSNLHIGLGWDAEDSKGNAIDCDVSVFMLNQNAKIPGDGTQLDSKKWEDLPFVEKEALHFSSLKQLQEA